jgi:hypothetical protein
MRYYEICVLREYQEVINIHTPDGEKIYGGWLDPAKREVHYAEHCGHRNVCTEKGLSGYHGAFKAGWVRYLSNGFPREFGVNGFLKDVLLSFSMWYPTAEQAEAVEIDLQNSNDAMRIYNELGLDFKSYFEMPGEKQKLLALYGPQARVKIKQMLA